MRKPWHNQRRVNQPLTGAANRHAENNENAATIHRSIVGNSAMSSVRGILIVTSSANNNAPDQNVKCYRVRRVRNRSSQLKVHALKHREKIISALKERF